MAILNLDRIEFEVANRLHGLLNNSEAEHMLRDRCVKAITLRSIDHAELFNGISVSKPNAIVRVIKSEQIVDALKTSGVLDLVSICINAQQEGIR